MKKFTRILPVSVNVLLILFMVSGVLLLQACNSYNSNDAGINGPSNGKGRVKIHMTDKPAIGNISAVMVHVVRLEIHKNGTDSTSGWQLLSDSAQTVNLLDLTNGKSKLLATKDLDPGTYSQIRMILGTNNSVTSDGNDYSLTIPSSTQTGIKINANITVNAGDTYNILLDFNAAQSIHKTGNGRFMMKPVIHSVNLQMDGLIKGLVDPASSKSVVLAIMAQDTVSTFADTTSGNFRVIGLTPGTYSLSINPQDTAYYDTTLTNIHVNSGDSTDVGTIKLRQKPVAS